MKLKVNRYGLEIIPEGVLDEAYIEEVLGLKRDGAVMYLLRKNAYDLSCIACLETKQCPRSTDGTTNA